MSTINEIVDNAMNALESGSKIQTSVRGFLEDSPLEPYSKSQIVAQAMSEFRTRAEDWINSQPDEFLKENRKKANNIVNDVSRICRNSVGYSIKCSKRAPDYEYTVEPWFKPTPAVSNNSSSVTPSVTHTPAMDIVMTGVGDFTIEEIERMHTQILDWEDAFNIPMKMLNRLINHHGREAIGKAAAAAMGFTEEK
jgi:hypothetical protein